MVLILRLQILLLLHNGLLKLKRLELQYMILGESDTAQNEKKS